MRLPLSEFISTIFSLTLFLFLVSVKKYFCDADDSTAGEEN